MPTAQYVFAQAFPSYREARSNEYKSGVLEALRYRFGEIDRMQCPFGSGTAQADAWHAGTDEGHRRARDTRVATDSESATGA